MEEKNSFYYKPAYKCGICGTEYQNVLDRARCELACTAKAEEEAKRLAEIKKKEEQEARKTEVDAAFLELHKLMTAYIKDYGHYEYCNDGEGTSLYLPSRTWHRFW